MTAARSICPVCGVRLHAGSTADLTALTAAHTMPPTKDFKFGPRSSRRQQGYQQA